MAYVYKRVAGKPIQEFIAHDKGVQARLEYECFEAAVRAEALLKEHRQEGNARIDIEQGDIDCYVILEDVSDRPNIHGPLGNLNTALSIEYGRTAGETVVRDRKTGELVTVKWGAMEGLYILHDAFGVARQKRGKVDVS